MGILVLASVLVAFVYYHQRSLLEQRVMDAGYGYLDSFVNESEDSIAKGQPQTFQGVMDNVARIEELTQTALFARSGLMTYMSGQNTLGKPFVHDEKTGQFKNPNEALYRETRGRYRRPDWNLRDMHETAEARKHIAKRESAGRECAECHFTLPQGASLKAGETSHVMRDNAADFYYALPAAQSCVVCHTNWKEGEAAGWRDARRSGRGGDSGRAGDLERVTTDRLRTHSASGPLEPGGPR